MTHLLSGTSRDFYIDGMVIPTTYNRHVSLPGEYMDSDSYNLKEDIESLLFDHGGYMDKEAFHRYISRSRYASCSIALVYENDAGTVIYLMPEERVRRRNFPTDAATLERRKAGQLSAAHEKTARKLRKLGVKTN